MKNNTLKRIEKALTTLVLDEPFFAVLAMKLNVVVTDSIPTFATEGKNLFVNPIFCDTLKDNEVVTVLAHEVLHCAMGHIWRIPIGADVEVWNRAIDNEANWILEERNIAAKHKVKPFPFPSCGAEMEDRFKEVACEIIYRTMLQEQQQKPKTPQAQQGKNSNNNSGFGEVIPIPDKDKGQAKEDWERAVVQAVNSTKDKGTIPGVITELVDKITSNKIDWRMLLRDFLLQVVNEDWSFRKPNPRYADNDFILPSLYSERVGKVAFAIDTSGSISSEALKLFIAEAQQALDDLLPENLILIYCDSKIQSIYEYSPGDNIELKITGRGGTDFRPVFEYLNAQEEPPKILVYLTDLDGTFPDEHPEYNTLWIVDGTVKQVPFGETIEI